MELLAPAGNWQAFLAAVHNGADAVYIGGKNFSARQSAENFELNEIKQAAQYAHVRGTKLYTAVNILLDNQEIPPALDYVYDLYRAGVDAVIVQDAGFMKLLLSALPEIKVHISTQMTVHNQDAARVLQEQGAARIVLARELNLDEIRILCHEAPGMEFEVFVHGALCYSYSGQCLFSSMVGGRSGNRGRCAQPCRLPYQLYDTGSNHALDLPGQGRYLLSPADLCLLEYLPELQRAGVAALKIEGRMKRPEYVAVVTAAYREVLDRMDTNPNYKPGEALKDNLYKIFNRNFSSGHTVYRHDDFLSTSRPNNRGVYTGRVLEQDQHFVTRIKLADTIALEDGLEVWVASGRNPAFVLKAMKVAGKTVQRAGRGDVVELRLEKRVSPGDRVFKTHDASLIKAARDSIKKGGQVRIPVDMEVELKVGQPMKLVVKDHHGHRVEVFSQTDALQAVKQPLDEKTLRDKLGRLGGTPFELAGLVVAGRKDVLLPFSDLNETRRRAVEELIQQYAGKEAEPILSTYEYRRRKKEALMVGTAAGKSKVPLLSVAVSSSAAAIAAIQAGAGRVYLALEGINQKRPLSLSEVEKAIQYGHEHGITVIPALPRIQKPGQNQEWGALAGLGPESILAGNMGALIWGLDQGVKVRADYSLNIYNDYTLAFYRQLGVVTSCLSPELNYEQLRHFNGINQSEVVVHGDIILMVAEHCLLRSCLGQGEERCSHPCRQGSYALLDSKGYQFPIGTDRYCRFYVFNSRVLCLMEDLPGLLSLGCESLRIEARRWDEKETAAVVRIYANVLQRLSRGEKVELSQYRQGLEKDSDIPFTRGHLHRGVLRS